MEHQVDEYIATLAESEQAELTRIKHIIEQLVPTAKQGVSYAMPAYLYKGKGLFCCLVNKNFMSIYPFSGKVVDLFHDRLKEYEQTTGSIHFSLEKLLPETLIKDIVLARVQEIDAKVK